MRPITNAMTDDGSVDEADELDPWATPLRPTAAKPRAKGDGALVSIADAIIIEVGDGGQAAEDENDLRVHEESDPDALHDHPRVMPARARDWVVSHAGMVIVGAVAVALAVALLLTMSALGNSNALGSARTSALAAARTDAVALAGYDYRHLNRDFGAVLAHSTSSFRRSFSQSSNAVKGTLTRYHATAHAKVVSAGLVSASTSQAVALVFLDQTVTNSNQTNPTTDRSQVVITLANSGGTWLIDQVRLL